MRDFAEQLIRWQKRHGRHDLPWQATRDPYRVWLSEIMLQQTQVSTVLQYFPRFLARFPDVQTLAQAQQQDVLALWSGMGYYSRARNLHRCAQQICEKWGGEFPRSAEQLQTLPGIGRSTAAAIASFCFGEQVSILDGNAKRLITRVLGFAGDLSLLSQERELWQQAQTLLPQGADAAQLMPNYTQGLMDLGATVCTRRQPQCELCPVASMCVARQQGWVHDYPVKSKKLKRGQQALWLLIAVNHAGEVALVKRPERGVWGGLHCLPVFDSLAQLRAQVAQEVQELPAFTHVLTHKDLLLHPVRVQAGQSLLTVGQWYAHAQWSELGLPAPIRKLLDAVSSHSCASA